MGHKMLKDGCINDTNYPVTYKGGDKTIQCPFYNKWARMRERCFNEALHKRRPTYVGTKLCDEWRYYSNFRAWMETQDWEGKELDKDLLIKGNKLYSPETCVFVSRMVNTFLNDAGGIRGNFMIGATFSKAANRFTANCNNPFTGKLVYLGLFDTELEAHLVWKSYKHNMAEKLAELETDPRIINALLTRYKE